MGDASRGELPQERRVVTPIPGPRSAAINQRRSAAVSSALGNVVPIVADRAGGGVLVDVDGNSFIDLGSGIAVTSVGNASPRVADAVAEQARNLTHTCFMVTGYEPYVRVCELLNELTPGDHPKRSALFNTGAEAVENAVKIARCATGRDAIAALEHGYHGRTYMAMSLTAKAMPYKQSFGPFPSDVYRVPASYPFRDGLSGPAAAAQAIARLETEVGGRNLAALVIEPIQGEGGFIVPAPGFVAGMSAWAREHGIVFIADEVQTGFCRTGTWFACEHEGVVPDLMTVAKGMGDGMPIAAVTGREDLMNSVHLGGLGGTFGGNPVSCAAAIASIETMRDQDLAARAQAIGEIMRDRLSELADECELVGDVRGRGAMMALEFTAPRTLDPIKGIAQATSARCAQEGVIVLTAGTYGNVVRLLPPLVIDDALLREGLDVLADAVLDEAAGFAPESP